MNEETKKQKRDNGFIVGIIILISIIIVTAVAISTFWW
jgi:hypothetical protein